MVNSVVKNKEFSGYSPFSFSIVCGWVLFGIMAVVSFFIKHAGVFVTLEFMPPVLELFSGIFIVVGSLLMLSSGAAKDLVVGWRLDKSGIALACGGWASQLAGIFAADYTMIGGMVLCVMAIAALATRYISSYTYSKYVKEKVAQLWNNGLALNH